MTLFLKKDRASNTNAPSFITSFVKDKYLATNSSILRYPNFMKVKITTDTCNFAISDVLFQNGHPVVLHMHLEP